MLFHLKLNFTPIYHCFNSCQKHHSVPTPDVGFFTWGSRFSIYTLYSYDWWLNWRKSIMLCLPLLKNPSFSRLVTDHLYLEAAATPSTITNQEYLQPAKLCLWRMCSTWDNFVALCPCFNEILTAVERIKDTWSWWPSCVKFEFYCHVHCDSLQKHTLQPYLSTTSCKCNLHLNTTKSGWSLPKEINQKDPDAMIK